MDTCGLAATGADTDTLLVWGFSAFALGVLLLWGTRSKHRKGLLGASLLVAVLALTVQAGNASPASAGGCTPTAPVQTTTQHPPSSEANQTSATSTPPATSEPGTTYQTTADNLPPTAAPETGVPSTTEAATTTTVASTSEPGTTDPTTTDTAEPTVTTTTAEPTVTTTAGPDCRLASDKSPTLDTDGDNIEDACDLDSDNDGILDAEEDLNSNSLFEDDDVDGDLLIIPVLGDNVSSYLDLDSDNDAVLDLFEGRPFSRAEIDLWDTDHNGVLDPTLVVGTNGLADVLETGPDSGVLLPVLTALRNTDSDDKPDFVDAKSDNTSFDMYQIDRADLDLLGSGFISQIDDTDHDGIMAVVDTNLTSRGAPDSPYSPYSS